MIWLRATGRVCMALRRHGGCQGRRSIITGLELRGIGVLMVWESVGKLSLVSRVSLPSSLATRSRIDSLPYQVSLGTLGT
jgi:hypothetical protein